MTGAANGRLWDITVPSLIVRREND
jgi:hypothetical protein